MNYDGIALIVPCIIGPAFDWSYVAFISNSHLKSTQSYESIFRYKFNPLTC